MSKKYKTGVYVNKEPSLFSTIKDEEYPLNFFHFISDQAVLPTSENDQQTLLNLALHMLSINNIAFCNCIFKDKMSETQLYDKYKFLPNEIEILLYNIREKLRDSRLLLTFLIGESIPESLPFKSCMVEVLYFGTNHQIQWKTIALLLSHNINSIGELIDYIEKYEKEHSDDTTDWWYPLGINNDDAEFITTLLSLNGYLHIHYTEHGIVDVLCDEYPTNVYFALLSFFNERPIFNGNLFPAQKEALIHMIDTKLSEKERDILKYRYEKKYSLGKIKELANESSKYKITQWINIILKNLSGFMPYIENGMPDTSKRDQMEQIPLNFNDVHIPKRISNLLIDFGIRNVHDLLIFIRMTDSNKWYDQIPNIGDKSADKIESCLIAHCIDIKQIKRR